MAVCQGDSAHQLLDSAAFRTHLQPTYRIEPASPHIALGRFTREGHPLLVLVNVARQDYDGQLWVARGFTWHALDPAARFPATVARLGGRSCATPPRATRNLRAPGNCSRVTERGRPLPATAIDQHRDRKW